MKKLGLSEFDVLDVYEHGEHIRTLDGVDVITKEYSYYGYEIGLKYKPDNYRGGYVIATAWKRKTLIAFML
jgi:hypothetical protein